jgi:broad specificity phosphatase PhoE
MKTRLIFVRHAEAEGNYYRIFHGWTDSGITEKGHVQAKKTADRLKDVEIDVLYSSSLKRTIQTAQYIADIKGLPIIRTDKLKEINGGDWEGRRWADLPSVWPHEYYTWENAPHIHRMPNGETMEEFQKRLINEVMYIIKNNQGKNICIVTHGTAIRALMCHFFHLNLNHMINIRWYDNTSISIIDYENERFKVIVEGDASHLGLELSTIQNQKWWKDYMQKREQKNGIEE